MILTRASLAVLMSGVIGTVMLAQGQSGTPAVPPTSAQPAARGNRPPPPTRDPRTPGYVTATNATELPDGAVPPVDGSGNYILGPTHAPAPEMTEQDTVPRGVIHTFTMRSADSKIYPGIARAEGTRPTVDPSDPAKRIVNSGPAPYTRTVAVYVPKQYVPGSVAPFIVGADGPDQLLFTALDNLIAQKRVPVMIASPSAMAAATRRAVSAAWNTTRCQDCMPSSSKPKCCRSSKSSTV
jgi:iron(III)-enterobactin esterase